MPILSGNLVSLVGAPLTDALAEVVPFGPATLSGDEVRLGAQRLTLAADGAFTVTLAEGAYSVRVTYTEAGRRRPTWQSNTFLLSTDASLADLVEADPYTPGGGATAGAGVVSVTAANSGTAYTVTAPTHGEKRVKLTLTGNAVLTLAGGTANEVCAVQLHLIQDGTGSRSVTWPSNLDWGVNGAPVLSVAAGKTEQVYLTTDDGGASWQGALVGTGYTSPIPPGAPTSLGASVSSGDVTLTWTQGAANGSTVTQNKIYRGTTSGVLTLLTTIAANTSYTDTTPLEDGTTYFYKVAAVNAVGEGAKSSEVSAVPGLLVVAADDFNRADATATSPTDGLIGQTTPTGGLTWLNVLGSGAWSVASGAAVANGANRKAGIDTGEADVTFAADVNNTGAAADEGLFLRFTDANNFIAVIVDPGGYYIQKTVGGTQSNVANGGGPVASGASPRLSVSVSGTAITVHADGVEVVTATITDGALQTGTIHGIMTGGTAAGVSFDNLQVTSP